MEQVSWDDAKVFTEQLSRKTGEQYRLLSEAEWEYVARAKTTTMFNTANRITADQVNYDGRWIPNNSTKVAYHGKTVSVGSFPPNNFGLYDVHGNVWEWTEDCWHESYQGVPTNGSAWTSGGDCTRRVLRGGSWDSRHMNLRAAYRFRLGAGSRISDIGFRVARTLSR